MIRRNFIILGILLIIAVLCLIFFPKKKAQYLKQKGINKSEKALTVNDTMAYEDEQAILKFVTDSIQGVKIEHVGLDNTAVQIMQILHIRKDFKGNRTPVLDSGSIVKKRMTWMLQAKFNKPFGSNPQDKPINLRLTLSLTEQAYCFVDQITERIAALFNTQPGSCKAYKGYWIIVSNDMENIFIDLSNTKDILFDTTEQKKSDNEDSNTYDFTGN